MNTAFFAWWNVIFVLPMALGVLLTALSLPTVGRRSAWPRAPRILKALGRGVPKRLAGRGALGASGRARHEAREGVPPLLWAQCLLLWWGACGMGCNILLGTRRPHSAAFLVAALGALALSLASASVLARLAPPPAREIGGRDALAGLQGEASSVISQGGGSAYVLDAHGVLHSIACFCEGEAAINRGRSLVTVEWDEAREAYRVREWSPDR